MSSPYPKISIITAVKNNPIGLLATIKSIEAQCYPNLEYIVVDGGSTDETLAVIKQYPKVITRWISEFDRGISDAFNKGIALSSGAYINFQGAGDTLYDPDCLRTLIEHIPNHERDQIDLICGQVVRTTLTGEPLWIAPQRIPTVFNKNSLLIKLTLPHQALLTHRRYFDKFGLFDIDVKYAMDYEILLRAYHDFPETRLLPIVISNWQAGGVGHNQIKSVLREYHRLKLKHRVAARWLLNCIHRFNLLKYYIKTNLKLNY